MDGKVTNLNMDAFRTLQMIKARTPNGPLTDADATRIKTAILKDNKVDEAEADLLQEIMGGGGNIDVSAKKESGFSPSDIQFNKTASAGAKKILESIKPLDDKDIAALWNGGPAGFAKLVDAYSTSSQNAEKITKFIGDEVLKTWDKSSLGNGYAPLRSLISSSTDNLGKLQGTQNEQGRKMLHGGMAQADKKVNDAIPDFLYNWIRPGGYI